VDGKCRLSSGYVVNNDKIFGFKYSNTGEDKTGVVAAGVNEESGCSDDNIGQLFTDKSAVCIYHGKALKFNKENSVRYYIMDGSAAKDTVFFFESEEYGFIVKSGEGYVIVDPFLTEGTLKCNALFFYYKYLTLY